MSLEMERRLRNSNAALLVVGVNLPMMVFYSPNYNLDDREEIAEQSIVRLACHQHELSPKMLSTVASLDDDDKS